MCSSGENPPNGSTRLAVIQAQVDAGAFSEATAAIYRALAAPQDLDSAEIMALKFELERMERIRRDFQATPQAVLDFIREYYPEVTDADIARWEHTKALEFMNIDGEKCYFNRAARNLFRIDKDMTALWGKLHPDNEITSGSGAKLDLDVHNAAVIQAAKQASTPYVLPKRIRITQSIEVDPDVVPEGETIRCWIPFPRLIPGRQEDILLLQTSHDKYVLAAEDQLQRTIYFEEPAAAGVSAKFSVQYELTAYGSHHAIMADKVTPLQAPEQLSEFVQEAPPHIQFTPALKKLSASILDGEANPYRQAQLLFAWVNENVPWASAREYSTIRCIPEYAFENGHGDCGIQTLLFMTLCRLNGIATRWQSGWELQPPDDSMHDWGQIYFEPYGWVPMDVTYGLRNSTDPELKWFYLSGMDSYRIIFNDGITQPFSPPKQHVRSETVDSQRGEVEWSGGNLYFNAWNWNFDWEIIE